MDKDEDKTMVQTDVKKSVATSKAPSFARPPFAEELFSQPDFKRKFDGSQGWQRHFVKQFVQTGSLELAAKQAGVSLTDIDPKLASQRQFSSLLDSHGLSNEDLVVHLADCVKAEMLIKDKHGKIHKGVDLKLKLSAIELILKLKGEIGQKKPSRGSGDSEDLFDDVDPGAKD